MLKKKIFEKKREDNIKNNYQEAECFLKYQLIEIARK